MKLFSLIILTVLILVVLAISPLMNNATIPLVELREERAATHFRSVRFAPETTTAWAVGFDGVILKTTDAGATWQKQVSNCDAHLYGLRVLNKQVAWTCGSNGTLIGTDNGGKTWKKVQIPTHLRLLEVYFINRYTGWVAGDNGYISRTDDGGKTWQQQETAINSGFRRIWFADKQLGYVIGYEGVALKTLDGGNTWQRIITPGHISFYGAAFQEQGKTFQFVGSCGTIFMSENFGETEKLLPVITTNFLRDISFDSEGYGVAAGYSCILNFDSETKTWNKGQRLPKINLQGVAMGPDGRCIAVGRWGAILLSNNHGRTWKLENDKFSPDLLDIAYDEQYGAVAAGVDGWTMIKYPESENWVPEYVGTNNLLQSCAIDQKGRYWVVGRRIYCWRSRIDHGFS